MSAKLSPLNFRSLIAREVFSFEPESPNIAPDQGRKSARRVSVYECPICDERHDWEEDAEDCCQDEKTPEPAVYASQCPVCGEKYESAVDASDCCIWKDVDQTTRHAMARRVEGGSTWARELGVWPPIAGAEGVTE